MVASSKVSSKVSLASTNNATAEDKQLDEQYSTLLHELFNFRKQDPDLFHTLIGSLHHQGVHEQQRRCDDLDTTIDDNNDDDDDIERQRNINDEREDMDSTTTNAGDNTRVMKTNSMLHLNSNKKKSNKKMERVPRLFDSETANIYYNAMKAKNNVPNKPTNTANMDKSSKKNVSWAEKKKTNLSKLELLNLQLALESIKVE